MFEITIKRGMKVMKVVGKEWTRVAKDESDRDVYGYTPEIEKKVVEHTTIYTQVVEELDLAAVIKAVNGMA